jgi:NAD(P)-dependent dehydrogenase (short-subunit alcohol dehydrogenase family)
MAPKSSWTPESLPQLEDRVYLVTGGNTGIGYWTVYHLAAKGATVYLTSRSSEKGNAAINSMAEAIRKANPGMEPKLRLVLMDNMSLQSVVAAAKSIRSDCSSLHGLVNSAGIMATPYDVSEDGFEAQWQTNYLAHWLLTYHLLPLLEETAKASAPGSVRVVNVSSIGHAAALKGGIDFENTSLENKFTFRRYAQSKLANILHATTLHKRYVSSNAPIWAISLHPGNVDTQLNAKSWGSAMLPVLRCMGVYLKPEEGSFTSLWAVAGQEITAAMSGRYFVPFGQQKDPSKLAQDEVLATRLEEWTEKEMREKGFLEGDDGR